MLGTLTCQRGHYVEDTYLSKRTLCWGHSLVKEDIMLGTHAHTLAYLVHVSSDIIVVDISCSGGWRKHPRQY